MNLHLLPTRTGAAAENMALDFLLLQRYPNPAAPRFRHYEWRGSTCTFGFGQKIEFVRAHLPPGDGLVLCRRPTGGGVVDHRNDWTYTLVIPRGHVLCDARATEAYRCVHAALVEGLVALDQLAELKRVEPEAEEGELTGPGVCFQRAELYDVINTRTGAKIAGAAMKRTKHGLLLQGSIEKGSIGPVDWDDFGERFTTALGRELGAAPTPTLWPELSEHEVEGLIEQYSAPEWNECR